MSEEYNNIDRFNLVAIALFAKLHATFPVPEDISPMSFGHACVPVDAGSDTAFEMGADAVHVLTWLEEEGFIRVGKKSLPDRLHGVRLTMKAMSVLGQLPSSLSSAKEKRPLIARMREVLANATAKAATDAASSLISEVFSLGLRVAITSQHNNSNVST